MCCEMTNFEELQADYLRVQFVRRDGIVREEGLSMIRAHIKSGLEANFLSIISRDVFDCVNHRLDEQEAEIRDSMTCRERMENALAEHREKLRANLPGDDIPF